MLADGITAAKREKDAAEAAGERERTDRSGAARDPGSDGERRIAEWFELYYDEVYQYLFFMLGERRGEAEDVLQEVFIKAYRNLHAFGDRSSPKTWLISIARNAAADVMRRRRPAFAERFVRKERAAPPADEPEHALLEEERRTKVLELMNALKPAQREVIFFLYQKELSVKETAELLDCKEAKIRTIRHRALRLLRKRSEYERLIGKGIDDE
ncbi:RNA polymerase sigma factor [Saccharibacillus alkalitolerans]|uniref:RNA polymerase sigma factor n=1 Tax=Saccharibacillus alkalitolerans TaxID=2705290 RepID=A0ABX0FAI5_9BACL|nr:RNA polymerase sigma factor [Saccharibacillus alkalitolerans]NGZ77947.1 RNA polymerase sigma factor [Saccharibacillus alkalitolerans]